jgi:cytochrome c biogenesis protein CcmG, thiol:disulfide interchange protein DsbE
LILTIAAALSIMAGATAYRQLITGFDGQADVGPEKGQLAPDFSVRTPDGETVRLSDFQGKIVLLNFFATWCGPCKKEAPHLKAAYERMSDDVSFLGVTFQDTAGSVRAFNAEFELPFPLTLDDSGEVGQAYRVRGLPTTFFIRSDGVVHYVVKGPMTKEFVELILEGMQGRSED